MEDIVPELYKKIKNEFDGLVSSDEEIQAVLLGENKDATFADTSIMARRLGTYATTSLKDNFTEEALPDGRLYWNIMERTIVPIMREVYELVYQLDVKVQLAQDKRQKIGIKPQKAAFPLERITAVMNKISNLYTDGEENEGNRQGG